MNNYRRFRRWCEKNPHSTVGSVQVKSAPKKLLAAALCCSLLAGGVFVTRAFGSSADEAAESVSLPQTSVVTYSDDSAVAETLSSRIGADMTGLSEAAIRFGLPQGASVDHVAEGAPADEAGLLTGDIITAVNGEAVSDPGELFAKLDGCESGVLTLSVYRRGGEIEMTVTVGGNDSPV